MASSTAQPLAGKVALITGSSKGIGAATALELASLGAKVVINYSSDSAPADELVKKIGAENAISIQANAGSIPDIERMVKETVDKFGKIDILIPNAGILPMRDLEHTTEEDWQKCYELNVKGPYFLCQKAVPHMGAGSHITLISTSLNALSQAPPGYLLYCSTKGAIEQMTRIMSKDLGRKGINVNCIAPGPTGTELFLRGKPQQLIDTMASWNPFNRLGTPEDIAKVLGFLSSEKSEWLNGQVIRANGGMTI